jgi:SpoVK/Ycf46/Vps4 family AAA+-type ATPase
MDQLKTQIVTMMGLRSAMNPTSSSSSDGIMTAIYAIFVLSLIESLFKYMPFVIAFLMKHGERLVKSRVQTMNVPMIANAINEIHSIILVRNYGNASASTARDMNSPAVRLQSESSNDNELVDALIEYITNLDNCKHLRFTSRFLINNTDDIQITPEIRARVEDYQVETDGTVSSLKLKLFSDVYRVSQLREFVDKLYKNYLFEKKNKFGTQRFFFNEIPHHVDRNFDGSIRIGNSPKRLLFNMTPFNTFKSLDNIFGEHLNEIKDRVNLFINNPEWYKDRGIPYTLGIMLYGRPGCGKTSMIKAIAKDSNRHIVNISLRENTTQRQLMNLFFDEVLLVTNEDGQQSTVIIPIEQRIYVIEDIDCLTSVVYDRESKSNETVVDDVKIKLLTEDQKAELHAYYDKLLEELEKRVELPKQVPMFSIVTKDITKDLSKLTTSTGVFDNASFNDLWNRSNQSEQLEAMGDANVISGFSNTDGFASINMNESLAPIDLQVPTNQISSIESEIAFIELQRNIHIFEEKNMSMICRLLDDNKELNGKLKMWVSSNPIEYSLQWLLYCKTNMNAVSPVIGSIINGILVANNDRLPKSKKDVEDKDNGKGIDERGAKLVQEDQKKELISLAFLLNLLDGVLETPGRILIITSNYPDKLDKALVRPGRIDVRIKFDYATTTMIKDMLKHFYELSDKAADKIIIPDELNMKYSPARIIEAFCNNYNNYEAAIKSLCD